MRLFRIAVVCFLVVAVSTSALAGDLLSTVAKAAEQQAQQQNQSARRPMGKGYLWGGTVLFAGGMAAALYGFLHNRNTGYPGFRGNDAPTFGEAKATNVTLGTVGLATAFAGGTLLFLGQRKARSSPSLSFGPHRMTVSQQLSW